MGVRVVFGAVVGVLGIRLFRGELFQPALEILVQPGLVVIDEYAGGGVRCLFATCN